MATTGMPPKMDPSAGARSMAVSSQALAKPTSAPSPAGKTSIPGAKGKQPSANQALPSASPASPAVPEGGTQFQEKDWQRQTQDQARDVDQRAQAYMAEREREKRRLQALALMLGGAFAADAIRLAGGHKDRAQGGGYMQAMMPTVLMGIMGQQFQQPPVPGQTAQRPSPPTMPENQRIDQLLAKQEGVNPAISRGLGTNTREFNAMTEAAKIMPKRMTGGGPSISPM